MDLILDETNCWQALYGSVHMGCTLSLNELDHSAPRLLTQVHGADIHDDRAYESAYQQGDGLISDLPGQALVVKTADCVPVTVTDGTRIGAVHAGWRGIEAGIVCRLLAYFQPERIIAVIGPAISSVNYEVDADLYSSWLKKESRLKHFLAPSPQGGTKRLFDLKGLVRQQLLDGGVPEPRIQTVPLCTYASSLPSYRRQGKLGRSIYSYVYRRRQGPR